MRILSLQTGRVRRMEYGPSGPASRAWRSATLKAPQEGARRITFLGVDGDEQADQENHGGDRRCPEDRRGDSRDQPAARAVLEAGVALEDRRPRGAHARHWPHRLLRTVLEPGDVRKGDEVLVLSTLHPDVTIARLNRARYRGAEPGTLRALADCPALAEDWRRWLRRRAGE